MFTEATRHLARHTIGFDVAAKDVIAIRSCVASFYSGTATVKIPIAVQYFFCAPHSLIFSSDF